MKTRTDLQEMWEKGERGYFDIWNMAYPCPECKKETLDFSAPRLNAPIVCRHCHTLFGLVKQKVGSV